MPKSASGARNAKPPAMARYFSTISRSVIFSDPNIRAGIPVRRIDVKQVRFFHFSEGVAQFRGAVPGAEKRAGRSFDPLRLVEAGNFAARNPQPGRRLAAIAAFAIQFFQTRFDRGGDFGAQTGRVEIFPAQEKILREILAVRFKCDHPARRSRQLRLQQASQAIEADGNFRPRGISAQPGLAAKIERIRNEGGDPVVSVFQMDTLRWPAHQPRPQTARTRTNRYPRISLVHMKSRHVAAMVPESRTALEKIRYHGVE